MTSTFAVRLGDLTGRLDANFAFAARPLHQTPWDVKPLGELATRIEYGSSTLATSEPGGTPMLRMNNVREEGWDLSDLKYVQFEPGELAKYKLSPGDVLVNRTNGTKEKELVGKSQVFREQGDWVYASYLIRMRFDESQVLPEYVSAYLNSGVGRAQVTATSRQILQTNVSASELRAILIPLPPIEVQAQLVAALQAGLSERNVQLQESNSAVAEIGPMFMRVMNIKDPPVGQPVCFIAKHEVLTGRRLDASAYRPIYQLHDPNRYAGPQTELRELAEIDPSIEGLSGELVPYSGLPECDLLDVRQVIRRPREEVQSHKLFQHGDLLFARIEPSVFNMKYPWARNERLKDFPAIYTSTEFYVVRALNALPPAFLFAAFRSSYVQAQVIGRTTGSSGRRRIDRDLFGSLLIPTGPPSIIAEIANRVTIELWRIEGLRLRAEEVWVAAREEFEAALHTSGAEE